MTAVDGADELVPLPAGLARQRPPEAAMDIAVIGTGYVGLVTGACLAKLGHRVVCADVDRDKIATLKGGALPLYEPGLAELLAANMTRLEFTTDVGEAVQSAELIMIAVGTPSG